MVTHQHAMRDELLYTERGIVKLFSCRHIIISEISRKNYVFFSYLIRRSLLLLEIRKEKSFYDGIFGRKFVFWNNIFLLCYFIFFSIAVKNILEAAENFKVLFSKEFPSAIIENSALLKALSFIVFQ